MELKIMTTPYIKINQHNETFFICKFKISELKKLVTFHFRHDGSKNFNQNDVQEYINKLRKKGLELESVDEGIQRRLEIKRINEIKDYLENNKNIIFPTTVILSCNIDIESNFYTKYLTETSNDVGSFEFDSNIHSFRIIDGQHRLAGMFISEDLNVTDLEISATILFNIDLPTEAKLFADINGKQKSVNKSLVYDLYEEIGETEVDHIYKYHNICKNLNNEPSSPLYQQIKMLGTGKGAISQSFFIDYLRLIDKNNLMIETPQNLYEQLFLYFKAFQIVFPEDWPLIDNIENRNRHPDYVLKTKKSQIVKTNGFGAILMLFPKVYAYKNKTFSQYKEIISKLQGQIDWLTAEGTGKQYQNKYLNKMEKILDIH